MRLILPYPPSINHYYRHVGNRVLISADGREYRRAVDQAIQSNHPEIAGKLTGALGMRIDVHPPDRRRRDLDNVQKPLLDALGHAGIYEDDSQIDFLSTVRRDVMPKGCVVVEIEDLPSDV